MNIGRIAPNLKIIEKGAYMYVIHTMYVCNSPWWTLELLMELINKELIRRELIKKELEKGAKQNGHHNSSSILPPSEIEFGFLFPRPIIIPGNIYLYIPKIFQPWEVQKWNRSELAHLGHLNSQNLRIRREDKGHRFVIADGYQEDELIGEGLNSEE